jgi:hypothetical protein
MVNCRRMAEHAEHGGHPKMFADAGNADGGLTTWQRFEGIAAKVFSVRKSEIDANKPFRRRAKSAKRKKSSK